jgi:hypothetical protein
VGQRRLQDLVARHRKPAPQLADWIEANLPEALAALRVPAAHWRRRTTNGRERLDEEIKRRTRVATTFPNEASLLRPASAVLSEKSDDWETERAYLTMEARCPTSEIRDFQKRCCFIVSCRRRKCSLWSGGVKGGVHRACRGWQDEAGRETTQPHNPRKRGEAGGFATSCLIVPLETRVA